ncbi:uncharacterized protein LOC113503855 [Trichoplusia ni]|uniref:Uncharacterized protein LOC113503832 n=1 Tax=Trichoplusia ni TaxID=7111 RepID=A0A7E5WN15_TRINI|nr:uncharacterized protein LOC113503832 [Trichoplusia ni]XP_026741768.1 uncharacterized protein LOC113503855 [Trichoplusia ni]
MHSELPVFKRCCCCFPLRYGLLVWGYIKLAIAALLIVSIAMVIRSLTMAYHVYGLHERVFTFRLTVFIIFLFLVTLDFALSTVFIVGGHKKNLKLLTVYYYYSIGVWILSILFSLFIISTYFIYRGPYRSTSFYAVADNILECSSHFVSMVSQGYFLLLLRSEMLKLKSNCEFRFVNNAAQSECKMNCSKGKDTLGENNGVGCTAECHRVISDV